MQEGDYDGVVNLWAAAGLSFKPEGRDRRERITQGLRSPHSVYLVALSGETIAGCVLGSHDGRKGWINRLAVLPVCQRRHLAMRLVKEAERLLEEKGISIVAALVEEGNEPSLALFEKAGYTRHRDITYLSKRQDTST